jgi:hypothetical protein
LEKQQTDAAEAQFLTADELAKLVNVPLKWIRNNSHKIPGCTKFGHLVRYRRSSVLSALAGGSLLKK